MRPDRLYRLAVLAAIADAGGLSAAARRLGVAKSSLSHHVSALEGEIGAKVLIRAGRGVALTPLGEALAAHGRAIAREGEAAAMAAREIEQPHGRLRLSMPGGIADALVIPLLAAFVDRYPGIALDIVATDQVLDLETERFDAAFRIGAAESGRFVARRLHQDRDIFVAAPAYLAQARPIERPADPAGHPWIGFRAFGSEQVFTVEGPDGSRDEVAVRCRVATSAGLAIKHWTQLGLGVARMPAFAVRDEIAAGRLVHVLPDHVAGRPALFVVYMPDRLRPANVRRLLEHAREHFGTGTAQGPAPLAM